MSDDPKEHTAETDNRTTKAQSRNVNVSLPFRWLSSVRRVVGVQVFYIVQVGVI